MRPLDFATISAALWKIPLPNVDCIVGIASGGIVPASLLAHQLRRPLYLLTINYRAPDNCPQRESPALLNNIPDLPPNSRILLVDDVSVSGQTLNLARKLLSQHSIITFTLKGQADYVLFPDIETCVRWPWKI
jgi:uncharacterized protein